MNMLTEQTFQEWITRHKELIAQQVVELQYDENPGYWEQFGSQGWNLSIRDAGYHLPFLAEAVDSGKADVFTDYVMWVKELFQGLGFHDSVMIRTLELTGRVLQEHLSEEHHSRFMPVISLGIAKMHEAIPLRTSNFDESTRLGQLARDYTALLLGGEKRQASDLVLQALDLGVGLQEIYLEVFQKSQYEIGQLWLSGKISVAQEHFCTAATQTIMSQLYPKIFSTPRKNHRMIAACIGGELHELGMRMVSDFFEMDGWDTWYLGANTPAMSIMQAAQEYQADLIGLSVGMPFHRQLLRDTIRLIRQQKKGASVKIIIGGNGLNGIADQWQQFGADGYAPDALKAVEVGNLLLSN